MKPNDLELSVRQTGERIFKSLDEDSSSLFSKDTWYRKIMDWSMKNEHFKVQMFRFVDVLPYLQSSSEVAKHLKEYFAESGDDLPSVFNFGLGLGSLAPGILAGAVKKNVTSMAKMFITGESPQDALPALKKARKQKITFTADLLGEATLSEKEAQEYLSRYLELIEWLAKDAKTWENIPQIDEDESGPIPKVNVSVKVTALYSQIDEAAWEPSLEIAKDRLRQVFRTAMANGVFINLDMEQYAHKDFLLRVFEDLILEPEFKDYRHWGIVIQAYLRDSAADVDRMVALAKRRGVPFTIRLVKGAYWDFETVLARQKGWRIPVYLNKKESDACFEICAKKLIDGYPHIRLALGSHNVRSISAAIAYARARGLDPRAVELQMLFGMADNIKRTLVREGYRVREYATIGELIPGMAYLVRRLLENTSNESFLRSKFADNVSTEVLLKDPQEDLLASDGTPIRTANQFYNEPPCDYAITEQRLLMKKSLADWTARFGRTYPLVIDGREVKTARTLTRLNPSHSSQVVGQVCVAGVPEADAALQAARAALPSWAKTSPSVRADLLDKLADRMTAEKFSLAALQVHEVGKEWREADGDVAEAIDFCRYYALEMRRLAQPRKMGRVPGELSLYTYQPRGVSLVIAPWNFPLAILTGMVTAAAVTGNTVIMKPAEQSSIIAFELMRMMTEVGFPKGVINYLPGYGEEIGEYLVNHKDVSLIAFTGSRDVGLHILKQAAVVHPGQTHIKRVIAELGGKNAIIVDSDADLDEAVQGVLYSAFGFQGQKCSACSRAVVLEPLYERFLERLLEAAKSFHVGAAEDPRSYMGPVVDEEAYQRIMSTIESAKSSSALAFQGHAPTDGYYVPPTIFRDVDPASALAQKEIFGPVLAVIKARDMDDALKIANGTEYALTGSLYSRSPATIERVKRDFEVGNLYVNRGSTGALVERHPFGGFKMSGIGSKAGGPDYLLQFMEPRVVTENTMRRGFVPSEE
ncbi:MAG: L-glutamate gamma-semialdehyde dehydrogenase [Bdellovibrionales bacterium]|nr:L-glutamate gamma-semialdehyde dehydrogenase [Bdellovibrionales bacterium]